MRRWAVLTCVVLFVSCTSRPGNDASNVEPRSAAIEGIVRETETKAPIAGVSVQVTAPSYHPAIRASTDAEGRFSLQGLAAGRHLVAVGRDGYVVPGRLDFSAFPFQLTAGQRITNAAIEMIPAGTVAGRVFNADGRPASRVEVQLLQNLYLMGRLQWSEVNRGGSANNVRVITNDRGEFRASGVDPGKYRIRLVPREATIESVVPGESSPAPALYPGVRDISRAESVEVMPGRETLLSDVTLKSERRAWIRVGVVNESGQSLEGLGDWNLRPPDWIGPEYAFADTRIVNNFHDFQPDAPGVYDILAWWPSRATRLAGKIRVNYNGSPMERTLTIKKPSGKLTGRVVIQQQDSQRPLSKAEVAIGPDISYFAVSGPDGGFMVPDVYEGLYQLGYIRGLPADTFVQSVTQGSRNVFFDRVVIDSSDDSSLEVVVSGGAGVLTGKVVDAAGAGVHNALVALVPERPLKDRKDYYGAYKESRTDQNGGFEIRGITPGSYKAYAWRQIPATAFRNEEFMKQFSGKGTPVQIEINEKETIQLEVL